MVYSTQQDRLAVPLHTMRACVLQPLLFNGNERMVTCTLYQEQQRRMLCCSVCRTKLKPSSACRQGHPPGSSHGATRFSAPSQVFRGLQGCTRLKLLGWLVSLPQKLSRGIIMVLGVEGEGTCRNPCCYRKSPRECLKVFGFFIVSRAERGTAFERHSRRLNPLRPRP